MTKMRIIGALSGTSMDSVSLGLFEFDTDMPFPTTLAHTSYPLPKDYKSSILALIEAGKCTFDALGQTDRFVGEVFADAILEFINAQKIDSASIDAIASHGQTIWHAPEAPRPFTLQIGDANIIAAKTGLTTIADFRRADMAHGGQGAPLAPAFHLKLFGNKQKPRVIVNVGGFANISVLEESRHCGFDSGPGNCLMDYWVHKNFQLDFDDNGQIAASGKLNESLLNCMLEDPYFARAAPKSTGREYFNPDWLHANIAKVGQAISPINVLCTLLHLTAVSISNEIKRHSSATAEVYICGGGAHNSELCKQLGKLLEQDIKTTETLGVHPDCMEAALFAWLGFARLTNQRIDLRNITGSDKPVALGAIFAA